MSINNYDIANDMENGLPFVAFVKDSENGDAARAVASSNGWSEGCVHYGDVRQAIVYLKEQPSPKILLVEISEPEEAAQQLDRLADVCNHNTLVIITSNVDEYSFYSWLKSIGIEHYLLRPFTAQQLQQIIDSTRNHHNNDKDATTITSELIACIGARGGVGATTITSNLAYIIACKYSHKTALIDIDPHFGSIAMSMDIQPGHGLRDALEKPDRIDDLFLDRVMVNYDKNLHILGAEEPFSTMLPSSAAAAEALISGIKHKYSYIIADIPRSLTPLTRNILVHSDHIILIGELSLLSLRDLLRLREYITAELHKPEPILVLNKIGMAAKHEMKHDSFNKNYGRAADILIPFMTEAFSADINGELLVKTLANSNKINEFYKLANLFVANDDTAESPSNNLPDFIDKICGLMRRN